MHIRLMKLALPGLASVLLMAQAGLAGAADAPPIRRVTLSTSGLADIERAGVVDGPASLSLAVPIDAVDDMLKTLVIQDPAGPPRAVRLPGQEPFAQEFRRLPFNPADLDTPAQLLAALRGAAVTISGARGMTGKIVSVTPETEALSEGRTRLRNRLTLLTGQGLESVIVEDAAQIAFADPQLRAQVELALGASLRHQAREQRVLEVLLSGEGKREVSLSYVVAAPLWKPSYRLLLPSVGDKALMQGWAVLENMTGDDWTDVALALTSGAPATYRQALYQSYYAARPELPVQLQAAPMPKVDRGAMSMALAAPPPPPPPPAAAPTPTISVSSRLMAAPRPAALEQAFADAPSNAAAEEAGAQVSFQFPGTFSVAAGQSLMAPLIAKPLAMERMSVYQPQTNPTTPLAAVRLTNDSGVSLPPGILTIYAGDRADFAGDAQLPAFPRGESRLISYALDQKTQIQRSEAAGQSIATLAASQGVLRATRKSILDTTYQIKAPIDEARILVIEHPRRSDYTLEDAGDAEATPTHYRLKLALKPGETRSLRVRLSRTMEEQLRILEMSGPVAAIWAQQAADSSNKQAITAFTTLAALRRAVAEVEGRLAEIERRSGVIVKDQERQRANLTSAPKESDLAKRSLAAISAGEDELAVLAKTRAGLESERLKAQQALEANVATLTF